MFIYQAETFCDSCGARIREDIRRMGLAPENPSADRSYDSDDYPKSAVEEPTDGPDHCASVGDCIGAAVDLGDYGLEPDAPLYGAESRRIGELLSDGLTEHGAAYLLELLEENDPTPYQVALHRYWRETFSNEIYGALTEKARELGSEHGRAAGSWVIDGNTTSETARHILTGLEDGDPAVYDYLPDSPLSGEWADDPTPSSVLEELGVSEEDDAADDYLRAYEEGFCEGVDAEVTRAARALLPGPEEEARVAELMEGAVSVAGSEGIAWRISGSAGIGQVRAVMVGDDSEHIVSLEDITPLEEGDYCPGCGQTGCHWH